jgi:4-amino-4-deoxy-L-arabinose transferase-like glycosyltransferase
MLQRTNFIWLLGTLLLVRVIAMVVVPFADTTEPSYAEIARLMMTTNDWITPWFEPNLPCLFGPKLFRSNYLASTNLLVVYLHCWRF